jgi:5-methylcytosine-specific restriction enzyme A
MKRAEPFYVGADWKQLMRQIIKQRGRACEDPRHDPARPRLGVRLLGDHVVELRDGGARLDPRNVMLRCYACHARKTADERQRRKGPRVGVDGWPIEANPPSQGGEGQKPRGEGSLPSRSPASRSLAHENTGEC